MDNALSIQTATVEIRVVKVGGNKMTLSTFKQIPIVDLCDVPDGVQVLGWVSPEISYPTFTDSFTKNNLRMQGHFWILIILFDVLCKVAYSPKENGMLDTGPQLYIAT